GDPGLRDRDPAGRARAGALGVPPLDELPLGGRAGPGSRGRGPRREGGGAHRDRGPRGGGPLRREPSAPRAPAAGHPRRVSVPGPGPGAGAGGGAPLDDEEDYALPHWAGVIPLRLAPQLPVPEPRLDPRIPVPVAATAYRRPGPGPVPD